MRIAHEFWGEDTIQPVTPAYILVVVFKGPVR